MTKTSNTASKNIQQSSFLCFEPHNSDSTSCQKFVGDTYVLASCRSKWSLLKAIHSSFVSIGRIANVAVGTATVQNTLQCHFTLLDCKSNNTVLNNASFLYRDIERWADSRQSFITARVVRNMLQVMDYL